MFAGRFHAELTGLYGALQAAHGLVHVGEAIAAGAVVPGLYGGLASVVFGAAVVGLSIAERRRQHAAWDTAGAT